MPPRPTHLIRTAKGNALTGNPARVEFAAEQLRTMRWADARAAIVKRWGVHPDTASRDIRKAYQLIALELGGMEARAAEVRRNERIADKAETLAEKAAEGAEAAADWGAVAALQKTAIAASREVSRLTGAYAPKKVEVTHHDAAEPALQLDAILAILDDAGRAAMHVVLEQIEAARTDGRLAPIQEDVEDAEIVEPEPSAGTN